MEVRIVSTRKHLRWAILFCVFGLSLAAYIPAAEEANDLKTDSDKTSYLLGNQFGTSLRAEGIDVNLDPLLLGIAEGLAGQDCALSAEEQSRLMIALHDQVEARHEAQLAQREADAIAQLGPENAWKIQLDKPEMTKFDGMKDYFWILETNKGTITIKLMPDVAPMHVSSTIFLTNRGFYDGLTFHRVIPDFMVQGGCPLGLGTYGPGYAYGNEFVAGVGFDRPYLVALANKGPKTEGSQFFITLKPTPWLTGAHTIFGEVTEGFDAVEGLAAAGTASGTPSEPLLITSARIEERPRG